MLSIAVVIPVHNAAAHLGKCLASLRDANGEIPELIVVDDGSTDDSARVAIESGARLLQTGRQSGPALARNLGVRHSQADVLFFLDADVCVHSDTLERVRRAFEADAELDAVIGCYDETPSAAGFVSTFKNLMHSFVHQHARPRASTFWCGCGAVRREVFLALGGFDEDYRRPAIEDIEFGYRLRKSGGRIALDRELFVKHLKRWTLWSMIRSDVRDRGIPWTELILRDRNMPDDLNISSSQRLSVILVWSLAPILLLGSARAAAIPLAAVMFLNRRFYRFLASRRGSLFAVAAFPLHLLYYLYSGLAFGIGLYRFYFRRSKSSRPYHRFWKQLPKL